MLKFVPLALCLAIASFGPGPAGAQGTARPPLDPTILHAQVILDHLGFSPGVLDGRDGRSFAAAVEGFQSTRGLEETGRLDRATLRALHPFRGIRPIRRLALTANALAGPFYHPFPEDPEAQAKLPALGYRGPMEKLAEMFHTTPEVLRELNPPETPLKPGVSLVLPNALPSSRAYPEELDPAWRATLAALNIDARQPEAARIEVDKSDRVLRVFDKDDRLVALFSATMGSRRDPLPLGRWKIQGESPNPDFHYNPELFWDVDDAKPKLRLPPGPNGPVGVVWLDLNIPHYGIHGTPEPAQIGRSESHGCIRLTNWDAARLSLMVKPGTPAVFRE